MVFAVTLRILCTVIIQKVITQKTNNMKKMKKDEEYGFLVNSTNEAMDYVAKVGICPPNQERLFMESREIFYRLAPFCKKISQEVLYHLIEEGSLELVMSRCLSTENQIKFVEKYPEKVQEYLTTLEKSLSSDRGAYLAPEAEELYQQLCEQDDTLPKIKSVFTFTTSNCPFAGLASLLS